MICAGSASEYKVGSLYHGFSDYKWRIYHTYNSNQDTIFVKSSDITLYARGDSIRVFWDENSYVGGFYTLEVSEFTDFGCTGKYSTDVILNTNTFFVPIEGNQESFASCAGNTVELDPGLFKNYYWMVNGSTNRTYITTEVGTYQVRLVDNSQSCTFDTIQALFHPLPSVWLGNDTILFGNQTLDLILEDPNFTAWNWSTGATTSRITVDGLSGNRTISVEVTDNNGCKNSDEIKIGSADYNKLKIPAAFTPNGDGVNDKWYFPKPDKETNQDLFTYFDEVYVKVFNRWGRLVWESGKNFTPWDGTDLNGKDLPMDSYHYIIRFVINGHEYIYKGSITIIR